METIRRGDAGESVRDVQSRLSALGHVVDPAELEKHRFGESTERAVRAFQQDRGLLVDGLVGKNTWEELVEAGYALGDRALYLRSPYFRGDDVRSLQIHLNSLGFDPGREDGILGEQTARATQEFQRNVGLRPDGIVGATTLDALGRLKSSVPGPGRTEIRETETLRAADSLSGHRVAIDPGHGPEEPGCTGAAGLVEADVTWDLAELLAAELRSRGAEPLLLRSREEDPSVSERASRANAAGADVLVALHFNDHPDPAAEGSSTYYFGRQESYSLAGRALADLVQEELVARTGLKDGRTHPKAFPILRESTMPAVQLEPCFLTNPKEEQLLGEDRFRRELAAAVAQALERYFAGRLLTPGGSGGVAGPGAPRS
ncbi:MAG TPA: N-acetylmuramoyl-L-alanine amidase [Actinomycetota bacterium]|nr:N-acetylmuramoyl-L-alanine amidase [Actinomycetota bacterium]